MTRHFDRSGRADQVASHLGPKSGMFLGTALSTTSKLCNFACTISKLGLILELALWTLLAPLSFACSIVSSAVSCLCNMECSEIDKSESWLRFMFGSKQGSEHSLGMFHALRSLVLSSLLLFPAFVFRVYAWLCLHTFVSLWSDPLDLHMCASSSHYFAASPVADLQGGAGNSEIGSKTWLDNILSGLAARHLKPPMLQVKMLVQNEATLTRLKKATELKQQLDIICGAAYKAQLGWTKVSSDPPDSSTLGAPSSNGTPVGPPPEPKVQSWRLRPRD